MTVWDAATGDTLREMTCGGEVSSVALSADGSRIVTGDGSKKVTVWDAATGDKLREMTCGGGVSSVALSADGSRIVSGDTATR